MAPRWTRSRGRGDCCRGSWSRRGGDRGIVRAPRRAEPAFHAAAPHGAGTPAPFDHAGPVSVREGVAVIATVASPVIDVIAVGQRSDRSTVTVEHSDLGAIKRAGSAEPYGVVSKR